MKLNIYQVATRFEVSTSTIFSWRIKGWIIDPIRLGKRVFWLEADLDQWEADGYPRPCDQPQQEVLR